MKRFFLLLYQLFIWLPLFFLATILTALITMIGCMLGGERIFSYYPGMIWSRFTCLITLSSVTVKGKEKLDKKQSYIFVANHQGVYDIFLIYGFLGHPIKWMMKESLRKIPFVGKACEAAGFIFVDNTSSFAAAKTIDTAEAVLKNGNSVAIFPEGSRTKTGKIGPFKKGAFHLALRLKLPIVPITINGSYEVMPIHTYLINPHRMELIIHDPIPADRYSIGNLRDLSESIRFLMEQSKTSILQPLWQMYKL